MKITQPKIVAVSAKENTGDTLLYGSTDVIDRPFNLSMVLGNSRALWDVYNVECHIAEFDETDCLIFVHDDVILEEDPFPKLEVLFDTYDLVGVAGASKIEMAPPALWHIMGGGFYSKNLHGCVQHIHEGRKLPTNFGSYPHRVVMIDGVFMALNRKAIETMVFDTENPCNFHFYDLAASMVAIERGLSIGVGDILITHASPGLKEYTPEWIAGNNWFLNKYGNK
jgi:hypothetical protein